MELPTPVTVVALLVAVVLVVTGPIVGVDASREPVTEFGDGSATVADVGTDADAFRISEGRFGTGVDYLRMPTATVTVGSVIDRPRLVYAVAIPALEIDRFETTVVTGSGRYRLAPDDYGMAAGTADSQSYTGTLTVRVQSFTTDQTVYRENVTVEVTT